MRISLQHGEIILGKLIFFICSVHCIDLSISSLKSFSVIASLQWSSIDFKFNICPANITSQQRRFSVSVTLPLRYSDIVCLLGGDLHETQSLK